jgi:hypothetical protein
VARQAQKPKEMKAAAIEMRKELAAKIASNTRSDCGCRWQDSACSWTGWMPRARRTKSATRV